MALRILSVRYGRTADHAARSIPAGLRAVMFSRQ
jgi:hypothetical protein